MRGSPLWFGCVKTGKVVLIGAVLLVFGCQSLIFDPRGHRVPEDRWVLIPDSGEQPGVYNNEDLTIGFKMVRGPGQLQIAGDIHFADRIAENFPIVRYFHLGALLLDDQGKILGMINLVSTASYRTQYATVPDYPLVFNARLALPGNVRAIAFNYTGNAIDPSGPDAGGTMDFWEYPVY